MTLSVGTLWAIYIIVVIVTFLIFLCFLNKTSYYNNLGYATAFFIATLLGAIAVFIGAAWLDPNQLTSNDKTWLSVLFIVAFILPVFVIIYVIWIGYSSECDACHKNPCCCKPVTSCNRCQKDPCCCKRVNSCNKCQKDPCCCKRVNPCDRCNVCQMERCECKKIVICDECSKNPCECKKIRMKQIISCNTDTGECHIKEKKIYSGDDVTKVIYTSNNAWAD